MKHRSCRFAGRDLTAALGLILCGGVFPSAAGAQVSLSQVSTLSAQSKTGPWTFPVSVSPPLQNAALFVYVDTMRTDRTGINVTLDGHRMSAVGTNPSVLVYIAVAPSTGAHALKVSGLSSSDLLFGVLAALFNGVDQSTPTDAVSLFDSLRPEGCGRCRGPLTGSAGPYPAGSAEAVFGSSAFALDCTSFPSSDWPIRTGLGQWGNQSVTGIARGWIYSAAPPNAAYVALVGNPGLPTGDLPVCETAMNYGRFSIADVVVRPAPGLTATVKGRVTRSDPQPAPVTVNLGPNASTTVDSQGNYSFSGVDSSQSYTLTFQSDTYTFSPTTLSVTSLALYGGATASVPDVAATPKSAPPPSSPSSPSPKLSGAAAVPLWSRRPNPKLKGLNGALVVALPPGTGNTPIRVRASGTKVDVVSGLGNQTRTLASGKYDVLVGNALISGVEIASGQDTTLAIGALRVNADQRSAYELLDESNRVIAKRFGKSVTALPAGTYQVRIGGSAKTITIESGQVIDY